jgi:hypothetical protein
MGIQYIIPYIFGICKGFGEISEGSGGEFCGKPKLGFVGQGLCPCTPPKDFLKTSSPSLCANLPLANIAKSFGIPKTFKKNHLSMFF